MAVSCTTSQWASSAPQVKLTIDSKTKTDTYIIYTWKLQYIASSAASTSTARSYTAKINGKEIAKGTYSINGKKGTYTIDDGEIRIDRTKSSQSISYSCSMAFNLTWSGSYAGTKSASGTFSMAAITSYTVKYNANGGSGAPSTQTKWHGTALTLSSTKPSRTGYSFNKWNTASGGTGTSYALGASYTSNASATLYAIWTANTYKVTYNANGGSLGSVPSSQTKTYGVNLTLSTATPTLTNYTFKGWGTSASATTVSYAKGATYTSNASITLYAIWELAYKKPTISNFTVARYDNTNNLKSDEGTSALVSFNWSSYQNVTSVKIHWKESTATSYSDTNSYTCTSTEASGKSGIVSKVIGNAALSTENSYDIKVTVTDSDYSYSVKNIPSIILPIDFLVGGKGVAIGKTAKTSSLLDVEWETRLRKNVCIGNKTGYLDGLEGVYINRVGYMHLQRSSDGGNPYYGFCIGSSKALDGYISLNASNGYMEFLGADGYKIDKTLVVSGTNNWLGKQRFNGEWIGLYDTAGGGTRKGWIGHDGGTALCIVNEAGGRINLSGADVGIAKDLYTAGYIYATDKIGYTAAYSTGIALFCKWKDGSNHNLITRETDGLTSAFGWAGSSSYATVTILRGRTAKYQNSSGTTTLSDRNLKKDFEGFTDEHDVYFDNLKPLTYKYKLGSSGRPHFGFITQEVEEALETAGMTTKDFAGVNIMPINCRETEEDENGNRHDIEDSADNYLLDKGIKEQHNLIYTEFISMNTWQIQKLKKRVDVLESKVDVLEEKSVKQEEKINKLEEEMQQLKELVAKLVS
jgi:uncharacterized repeat protein (TIGR02543 family)